MSEVEFRGAAPPPAPREKVYEVTLATLAAPIDAILLSRHITGIYCHWEPAAGRGKGRTVWCCRMPDCPRCRVGAVPQFTGYIPYAMPGLPTIRVAALPLSAVQEMQRLTVGEGGLRGLRVVISRLRGRPNGPCSVRPHEHPYRGGLLPEPRIMPTIRHYYPDIDQGGDEEEPPEGGDL